MKTVMITLEGDIPDTELGKQATVTINGKSYNGQVRVILVHEELKVTSITLQGMGLKTAE